MADTLPPIQSPIDNPDIQSKFNQTELGQYLQQRNQPAAQVKANPLPVGQARNYDNSAEMNKISEHSAQAESWAFDPLQSAQTHAIGVGANTGNFERYYTHPLFKQLGYSPYRDNETIYNKNSSGSQEFSRMMTQWPALNQLGAKDMWQEIFDPGISNDVENARTMNKAMKVGSSSKEGFGGWMTNFGLNTAYTAGILEEMAAEEVALAAITYGTGGASVEVTGPLMAARLGKSGKALYQGVKSMFKVKEAFDAIKTAADAKRIFDMSRLGAKGLDMLKASGRFLNPLEQTTGVFRGAESWDALASFAGAKKTAGALWRDLRETRAVMSEARLEGGTVENDTRDNLIAQYRSTHNGELPTGDEAKKINELSKSAGFATAMANMPAIYLSNKIVFETALKGFKPVEKILADEGQELAGRIVRNKPGAATAYERVGQFSKRGIQDRLKPSNILKGSLKYSMANIAEGLQESAQEAISLATKAYYEDVYRDPSIAAKKGLTQYIKDGVGAQLTAQGLDTFLSGFLMGGTLQGPQNLLFKGVPKLGAKVFTPGKYKESQVAKEEYTNKVFNAMNAVAKDKGLATDLLDQNTVSGARAYKHMQESQEMGDQKGFEDSKDESMFSHIHTLLQSGKYQVLTEQIDALKELSDSDLADAFNRSDDTPEQMAALRKRLDNFEKRAIEVKERFEWVNDNIKNPFNRQTQTNDYLVMEDAKKMAVFSRYNFDRTLERMTSVTNDAAKNKPLSKASSIDFTLLFDKQHIQGEITGLESEIKLYKEGTTPGAKTTLKQKQEKLDALRELSQSAAVYSSLVARRTQAQTNPQVQADLDHESKFSQGAKVKDKSGKVLTISKIYKNGKVSFKNIKGLHSMKDLTLVESAKTQAGASIDREVLTMHAAYDRYVKAIARSTGDRIIDSNVERSFKGFKDFQELSHDADTAARAVNHLTNPEFIAEYVARGVKIRAEVEAQKEELMRKALQDFMDRMGNNDLLNDLFNIGVFIHPNEIEALINENKIPLTFLDTKTLKPIDYASEKYKEIEKILDEYAQKTGKDLSQKPIPEKKNEASEFRLLPRRKFKSDKRTYKDQAEEFGFDPEVLSSDISLRSVLEAIIDGEYTTVMEKLLARKFLTVSKPEDMVTFKKNLTTPGNYNIGDDSVNIDARYTSSDYENGGTPIEEVILHEIGHKFTLKALVEDEKFDNEIEELLNKTLEYTKTKAYVDEFGTKPLYGLKNQAEFVTEALSNPNFQRLLRLVPYDVTKRTTWDEFLSSVKRMLGRLFGVEESNTILDQALGIITAKIDRGTQELVTEKPAGTTSPGKGISIATPIAQMPKELVTKLVDAYRAYNNALDEEEQEPLESMSNDIIARSDKFRNLIQGGLPIFSKIIDEYNGPVDKTLEPVVTQPEVTGTAIPERTTEVIPNEEAFRFAEDGFISEARKLSIAQKQFDNERLSPLEQQFYTKEFKDIDALIDELQKQKETGVPIVIPEEKPEPIIVPEVETPEQIIKQLEIPEKEVPRSLQERFDAVTNLQDLVTLQGFLVDDVLEGIITDTTLLNKMIEDKTEELSKSITFENIKENEILVMKDKKFFGFKGLALVVEKTDSEIKVRKLGEESGSVRAIGADQLSDQIEFKYNEGMESTEITPEATPEDKEVAEQNIKANEDLLKDKTEVDKLHDDAAKKSKEENDKEFFDDLGCEQ